MHVPFALMSAAAPSLPILARRDDIVAAIRDHQVTIICGETGSGKTTQLPQIMLAMGLAEKGMIGHTQPRRLAARAVAARIAEERGERLGGTVGVKVRFQDTTSRATKIKLLTDGMLLAELGGGGSGDPQLRAYSAIIIDEAHERSLNIDFLLGYLRTLLAGGKRPDLKLVITSATIDPQRFANYFASAPSSPSTLSLRHSTTPTLLLPPIIEVSGRGYPVEVRYRPYKDDEEEPELGGRVEVERVADAVEELTFASTQSAAGETSPGSPPPPRDILVFLPGEREIRLVADALRRRNLSADILPLFSRLTNEEQDRIFHPGPRQRIILATNVAETSLTVPGIRSVVDTGLARISRYDPARKIQRLPIEPISRASSNQRSGRCGRVAPGVCIRLYSESLYAAKPAFTDPEIRRTNLASVILQMKSLHLSDIEDFPFLDAPDAAAITDGYETLFELGAITQPDRHGALTPIGEQMSRIPTDPRIARMLIGAQRENAVNEIIILAAALSIQDPRDRPLSRQQDADRAHAVFRDETSDFLTLLKLWDQFRHASDTMPGGGGGQFFSWCRELFVAPARLREWKEMHDQLRRVAEELDLFSPLHPTSLIAHPTSDNIHRALLTGLITNVACREGDGSFDYRGVRGNVVQIFPGSVLFKKGPKWMMAAEIVQTTRLYARTIARVQVEWIEELAGHMFRRQFSDAHLDPDTGEPSAWERVTMSGIVVVPRRRAALGTPALSTPALRAGNPPDPGTPALRAGPQFNQARAIFLTDALAECKWKIDAPFMLHNRATLTRAAAIEAKLRRRNLTRSSEDLGAWFAQRIPANVCDPTTFKHWRIDAERTNPRILFLNLSDILKPEAARALDELDFPDVIEIGKGDSAALCPIDYALAPGKDDDGLTLTIALRDLPALTVERAEWLVPGALPDLIAALIRTLPKPQRASIEVKGDAAIIAATCAEAMTFAGGPLPVALSEALEVLHNVKIDPATWQFRALPAHLQLRVRVIDDSCHDIAVPPQSRAAAEPPRELALDRDLPALLKRLAPRLKQLRAAEDRASFGACKLTTWNFGDLPDSITTEREGATTTAHPTLIDHTDSVSLTLAPTPREAELLTRAGLRRLFALACADEAKYYLESHPAWNDMRNQFTQLGTPEELRDQLTCIIAERTFIDTQPTLRTQAAFEDRRTASWGRLSAIARETCDAVARVLDSRAQIARRFSGGTPRLWAESVADIREQAAYLMPHGFLVAVRWDQLRRYPIYVEVMRERLLNLREDGSKSESGALAAIAPHWKRFTGWVAKAMSAGYPGSPSRVDEPPVPGSESRGTQKAPLPQAKRAAPTINLDAGEWAMRPGNLPAPIERYRWAIEEFRLSQLAPDRAPKPPTSPADLEKLWRTACEP